MFPPQRGLLDDDDLLETWITRVCDAAADTGVTPLLHHDATHIEQPDETEAWFERCPENLGLLWDSAHEYLYGENAFSEDVTDGIERFADDIEYVHLKDINPMSYFPDYIEALSSGTFNLANVILFYYALSDLGDSVIDFEGVADVLSEIGYDSHVTIEMEKQTTDTLVHAKRTFDHWLAARSE